MSRLSPKYKQARSRQDFERRTATFGNLRKSSEHLRESSAMFGQSSEHLRQCLEVVGNFSEIRVIWIRKTHAFDLGKVGRYRLIPVKSIDHRLISNHQFLLIGHARSRNRSPSNHVHTSYKSQVFCLIPCSSPGGGGVSKENYYLF